MHQDSYLERAQECLKLAAETPDFALRESLTQAAVRWEQLAAETGDHDWESSHPVLPIPQF